MWYSYSLELGNKSYAKERVLKILIALEITVSVQFRIVKN